MNKVILIIPYFGKFNNFFDLWLKSAEDNKSFDFLFFSDNNRPEKLSDNIYWNTITFSELKRKIQAVLKDTSISLRHPYKLCDYRPMYGKLFKEYIVKYEFWGYCDVDLIFGNILSFLDTEKMKNYDKFFSRGHLTIFRNNTFFEDLFTAVDVRMPLTYREAWHTDYSCHFDEMPIWNTLVKESGYRCYDEVDFADIDIKSYRFKLAMGEKERSTRQIYKKEGIKLYQLYKHGKVEKREMLYIHLQKRKMSILLDKKNYNEYYIVPNIFLTISEELSEEQLINIYSEEKFWPDYYVRRIREIIHNLKSGALKIRMVCLTRRLRERALRKK